MERLPGAMSPTRRLACPTGPLLDEKPARAFTRPAAARYSVILWEPLHMRFARLLARAMS
jgi:hypothetical protein